MTILPNGVAVAGSTHHAQWCATEGLVHDKFTSSVIAGLIEKHGIRKCVEGGAHIGSLTRVMLDAGCEVLAFEPNQDAWQCLIHNCRGELLTPCHAALGEAPAKTSLVLSDNAGASFCSGEGDILVVSLDALPALQFDFLKLRR